MEKKERSTSVVKSISGIMLCTLAFKILGFFRELVLSYYYGTSGTSDAYLISQTIPSVIFEFVGAGISTCFIPIYFKVLTKRGKKEAFSYTNRITTLTLCFSTLIIIIVWCFTPIIVKMFASGFSGETLELASGFTRICILSLYFSSFVFIYGAFLQANGKFMPNAASAVILNICVLASIIVGANTSIWVMSIGSSLAVGVRLFLIIPAAHKQGLKTRIDMRIRDPYVREFFVLMLPVIIGTSVNEVNTLVDRTIASQLAVGGISALTYSNSMLQLAIGGVVYPFSTVVYPQITDLIHKDDDKGACIFFSKMLNVLLLLLIPITVGILIYNRPIVNLLFGRGAFDEQALTMTSEGLKYYALGLCFIGLREMISRLYYAYEDTKTPMINSSIGLVINVVLNLVLSRLMGLSGLAFATSLSAIATTALLWKGIDKRLNYKSMILNFKDIIKFTLSSVIMGVLSWCMYNFVFHQSLVGMIVSIVFAVFLYFAVLIIARAESISEIKRIALKLLHKE